MAKVRVALSRAHAFNKIEMEISDIDVAKSKSAILAAENVTDEIAGAITKKSDILKSWGEESKENIKPTLEKKYNNNYKESPKKLMGPATPSQVSVLYKMTTLSNDQLAQLYNQQSGKQYASDLIDACKLAKQDIRFNNTLKESQNNNITGNFNNSNSR